MGVIGARASNSPLVVCVAPNGARRGKADHPALPVTLEETLLETQACAAAGATALHLHIRDDRGAHTLDPERYRSALTRLQGQLGNGLLVQITTEAVGRYTPEQQRAVVREVRPDAVSVALREMIPAGEDPREAQAFFAWTRASGIAVQYILYAPEEVTQLLALTQNQVVPSPAAALFVLGRYTGPSEWHPSDLPHWLVHWPPHWPWMVCGFGAAEATLAHAAIGLGGHVRVGFENNLWLPDGTLAQNNAQSVALCAQQGRAAGRMSATRRDARWVLGACES